MRRVGMQSTIIYSDLASLSILHDVVGKSGAGIVLKDRGIERVRVVPVSCRVIERFEYVAKERTRVAVSLHAADDLVIDFVAVTAPPIEYEVLFDPIINGAAHQHDNVSLREYVALLGESHERDRDAVTQSTVFIAERSNVYIHLVTQLFENRVKF